MARLFAGNAGTVSVIRGNGAPALIRAQGFNYSSAVITTVAVSHSCNVQFQPSLRNSIYIYSFGDDMGMMKVQGVAFMGAICSPRRVQADGVGNIFQYYANNRVARRGTPISVAIGRTVLQGFLISMNIGTQDVVNRFFTFELVLAAIPPFSDFADPQTRTSPASQGVGTRPESQPPVIQPAPPAPSPGGNVTMAAVIPQ